MKDLFVTYIENRFQDVPWYVYVSLVLTFLIGSVVITYCTGLKKSLIHSSLLLLVEYVFLLISSTVFFRTYNDSRVHKFRPFWSYYEVQNGNDNFIPEIVMNILVFTPIGFLLGCCYRKIRWWKVMLIGFFLSAIIEIMQLVFDKGYAEVDDLIHNTIGCVVGYGLYCIVKNGYKIVKRS